MWINVTCSSAGAAFCAPLEEIVGETCSLEEEFFIRIVVTDPEPSDCVSVKYANSAVTARDSH
jgi:hypothetical protein